MNILAISPFPPQQNGGAIATFNFLSRLADKGHNIEVISYLETYQHNKNLNVYGINTKQRASFFRGIKFITNAIWKGYKIGRKFKPDIIYGKNLVSPSISAYFVSKLLRRPLIVHTSGVDIQELDPEKRYWQSTKGLRFEITKFIRKRILKRSIRIIANCRTDEDILEKIGFGSKTIFLRNGVDKERFTPKKKNFNRENFTICFVGRPEVEKNPQIILELAKKIPNEIIMIGGTEKEFERFGTMSKNINAIGMTDQIERYYNDSQVFVLPSKSEGLSNAMLEAMVMGLVAIVYPSGDAIYVIENESNGYLCESLEEIVERIQYLQKNPDIAEKISKTAREYIISNFDWEQSARKFEEILITALKK